MRPRLIPATILLLYALKVSGQSSNYYGVFPTIDHSGTISKKLDYSIYYFGAFNLINEEIKGVKEESNLFAFYAEQALSYKFNPNLSLTGSYVFERQRPFKDNYRNENRFYLQVTYRYDLGKTSIKHRLRYDGRFIEDMVTRKSPYTSRVRYLFGLASPLLRSTDKLYFSAYNEFFFNTYKSATAIYGENWAYAGIGYKTKHNGSFELGTLYIFWVNSQTSLTNFYYLQLCWVTHVNFMKKK